MNKVFLQCLSNYVKKIYVWYYGEYTSLLSGRDLDDKINTAFILELQINIGSASSWYYTNRLLGHI